MVEMLDTLREHFWESLGITTAIVVVVVVLTVAGVSVFSPSTFQSVQPHDMGGGVTCYTFNTSIDCLQIGE
jgi:hypothetical protein